MPTRVSQSQNSETLPLLRLQFAMICFDTVQRMSVIKVLEQEVVSATS